jgi:exopolysaccharide production protein ExoQ
MDQTIFDQNTKNRIVDGIIVGLTFFLSILRVISIFGMRGFNCEVLPFDPDVICTPSNIIYEISLWIIIVLMIGYQLFKSKGIKPFINAVKNNCILMFFTLLVFLSTIWTVSLPVTLSKATILLLSVVTFAYFGWHFTVEEVIRFLVQFFSILAVLNILFIIYFPKIGTMSDPLYFGSWTGIFWHKNYMGSIMAFGSSLLFIDLLTYPPHRFFTRICEVIFLLLSIWEVIKSQSAAGLIILIILLGICLIFYLWLKIRIHLRPLHYIILACIAFISIVIILFNLDFIFGLLNRNTSLTGRLPLWHYLINEVIINKPWLGYGYGAIWAFQGFRELTRVAVGWMFPIMIGDNGLIDITLHLGIAGLIMTLTIYAQSLKRSIQFTKNGKILSCFFPFIGLIFAFLANITLSMFLELEYIVWFLIVFPFFINTSPFTDSRVKSVPFTKEFLERT